MKKILIVDDSPTIVNMMKKILSKAGFKVDTILDSSTFFNGKVEKVQPDLLILDINMPKLDGFYVLENIKKKNMCPKAKIIMCSTKFFEYDMSRAKELGADDFLVKPFNYKTLIERVSLLIGAP